MVVGDTALIDVVVLGSSPTGLYALRELAGAGLRVACADVARGCAMASRHVRSEGRFVGTEEDILAWLRMQRDRGGEELILLPTSDLFIEFVARLEAGAEPGFRFFDGYRDVASELLDKARFHALCLKHGMATPGVWHAPDNDTLRELAGKVPFPCILKPVLIHRAKSYLRGKKVLLARSAGEYASHVEALPPGLGGWLVQEIIPGEESRITLLAGNMDRQGDLQQAFTARKLRQYPPGFGSASLVSSEACPETLELSARFLAKIGFHGVCGAEFKRDPRDEQLKIIEINPRPTLWFQAAHDAGKRPVLAAVADIMDAVAPVDRPQNGNVVWRYALKDAASALYYRRHGRSFVFPPPAVGRVQPGTRRSWPVFSAEDPMPALVEPLGFLRKAWSRR